MQIRGKLTPEEAYELRRILLTPLERWTRFGLGELLGVIILVTGLILPISEPKASLLALLPISLFVVVGGGLLWGWSHRRLQRQDLQRFLSLLPDHYELDDLGISTHYSNGMVVSAPWGLLKGWREADNFLILDSADSKAAFVFAMHDLSLGGRRAITALFAMNIKAL